MINSGLKDLLVSIVNNPVLHSKWLNTLSMMENTGARKISASEHSTKVTLLILKHAAEEARHAYYLKKQIAKIDEHACIDYTFGNLIAPLESYHYLHALDAQVCRYLKTELNFSKNDIKYPAYLLVTYAIEERADKLYPVYQEALTASGSKVNVKSIIAEEEGHLEEMIKQLEAFSPEWQTYAQAALEIEEHLFQKWINKVDAVINRVQIPAL